MSAWQDARFVRYDYIYYDTSRCAVGYPRQWLKFHVIPCVSMEGVCCLNLRIDWLGNWLVHLFDWLVGLLIDRLIGELFGCLIVWWVWLITVTNRVIVIHGFFFRVNSLIDWFSYWLLYFLVDWLFTTLWMIPWNSMCSKSLQGAFRSLKHTQQDGIECTSNLHEIPLFYLQSTRNVSPYSIKWNNISKWIFN